MLPRTAAPRAALSLLLGLVRLLLLAAAGARGEGSSPASAPASGAPSLAATAPAASRAAAVPAMPECGFVTVTSPRCTFRDVKSQQRALVTLADPIATVLNTLDTTMRDVPYGFNSLRRLLEATFPANPANPTSYLAAPKASFTVAPSGGGATVSGTARLIPSRRKSVRAPGPTRDRQYVVKALERGPGNDDVSGFPAGRCTMVIRAPCSKGCPEGEADFGDGCVAVCPDGEADFGSGCVPATCNPDCTYADMACAAGSMCPGGTLVSTACADRSAYSENPCACTALQQLAALSPSLPPEAPWNDLAGAAYCQTGSLYVICATVDGVQLPADVVGYNAGLAGALPPSLGELVSLTRLRLFNGAEISSVPTEIGALTGLERLNLGSTTADLRSNAITSLPTEIAALTGLTYMDMSYNAITSVPTEIGALTGLESLSLGGNAITSAPTEIGALTGLTLLTLGGNAITSVPTEIGALTGLQYLNLAGNAITSVPFGIVGALKGLIGLKLYDNELTGVPAEFRTVGPSEFCELFNNPGFSCANVGAGTSCCTGATGPLGEQGNNCGEGLSGGPCYAG